MNAELSPRRPSLRIERFTITNYRTFRDRTELLLQHAGQADPMPVFHGDNGSGKSNALAALDLFFRAARLWVVLRLQQKPQQKQKGRPLRGTPSEDPLIDYAEDYHGSDRISISPRDWPPGVRDPMELEAVFADSSLGTLRVRFVQAGKKVILQLERRRGSTPDGRNHTEFAAIAEADRAAVLNRLEAPHGANSHALYWLDARRRERSPAPDTPTTGAPASPLSGRLLERLFALQTSMIPAERDRWRAFTELLREFPSLEGQETSLVTVSPSAAELRLEWRGRLILRHTDLSSGEAMCGAAGGSPDFGCLPYRDRGAGDQPVREQSEAAEATVAGAGGSRARRSGLPGKSRARLRWSQRSALQAHARRSHNRGTNRCNG